MHIKTYRELVLTVSTLAWGDRLQLECSFSHRNIFRKVAHFTSVRQVINVVVTAIEPAQFEITARL